MTQYIISAKNGNYWIKDGGFYPPYHGTKRFETKQEADWFILNSPLAFEENIEVVVDDGKL